MTAPALAQATAGFPGSAAWWKAQVYDPLTYLYGQLPKTAVKSADTTVTNSTTVVFDSDLTIPLAANTTYTLEGFLLITCATAGVGGYKMNLPVPSGTTGYWVAVGPSSGTTADPDNVRTIATLLGGTTRSYGVSVGSSLTALTVTGYITTGSTAGSLQLSWAQLTANAAGMTLKQYSWLKITPTG